MSDTTNDTSAIDEKKEGDTSNSSTTLITNIKDYIISLLKSILHILVYFTIAGFLLFSCKLAQSNILPTEPNCAPYTNVQPNIEKIQTNIFTTLFTDPEMSMKLEIPNDERNSRYKIIDMFKDYKEKPNSNFLANYFIAIIEGLMQFDYSFINTYMNLLNGLPEIVIILIGPFLGIFIFMISIIINHIYFIYLFFASMFWFFKTNTNISGEGKPEWESVTLLDPINWGIGFLLVILYIVIFFIGMPIFMMVPLITLLYCRLSCLFYKGKLNGKPVSSFSIVLELLKHYKVSIVSLISLFVVLNAFTKLGPVPGAFSILTIILIYFGIININIFKSIPEKNLSPSVSYDQAIKKCPNKSTALYGGGNITKQLKKINKTLLSK
jgi:hypothetical protein